MKGLQEPFFLQSPQGGREIEIKIIYFALVSGFVWAALPLTGGEAWWEVSWGRV